MNIKAERKSIIIKSDCKKHGSVDFNYYPQCTNKYNAFRCTVCKSESKQKYHAKNKHNTSNSVRKPVDNNLRKSKLLDRKLLILNKYESVVKDIFSLFNIEYDKNIAVKKIKKGTSRIDIIDVISSYCIKQFTHKIKKKEIWKAATIVKNKHGLVKTIYDKNTKTHTTLSIYSEAPLDMKEKVRTESSEYANSVVEKEIKPYLIELEKIRLSFNQIEEFIDETPKREYLSREDRLKHVDSLLKIHSL
jgi:hypothetical protein